MTTQLTQPPTLFERSNPLFERLPSPGELRPGESEEFETRLRATVKPALRERLRQLYASPDLSESGTFERIALELRLQEIDAFLQEVSSDGREGWQAFADEPAGMSMEGHHFLRTVVPLAYTPCNSECVHGPLMLQAMSRIAQRLCRRGERLEELESIRWQRPVRRDISVVVHDPGHARMTHDPATSAVTGGFRTTEGRQLLFEAAEGDTGFVTRQYARNSLSQTLVAGRRITTDAGGVIRVPLAIDCLSAGQRLLLEDDGISVATLVDLASIIILTARSGIPALSCGAGRVPVDALRRAGNAGRVEMQVRADSVRVSEESGLRVVRYGFQLYPSMEGWSTLVMAEASDMAQMLRLLHGPAERPKDSRS